MANYMVYFLVSLVLTFLMILQFKKLKLQKGEKIMNKNLQGVAGNVPKRETYSSKKQIVSRGWATLSLLLAFVVFAFMVFTPRDADAMNGYMVDIVAQFNAGVNGNELAPGGADVCGGCHNDWGGRETRSNWAVMYLLYDNNTQSVGDGAVEVLEGASVNYPGYSSFWDLDSDMDGIDNYTETLNAQNITTDGSSNWFPMYPDKDGDGYIQLIYRQDANGMPGLMVGFFGDAFKGGDLNYIPLGYDIDDNDPSQGHSSAWPTAKNGSMTMGTTADTYNPEPISDFRAGAMGVGTELALQWSAPADDDPAGAGTQTTIGAHNYDIRFTTDAIIAAYNTANATTFNIANMTDWVTMYDLADTDVDDSTGLYLHKTLGEQGSAGGVWNLGEVTPLMRALGEPVPNATVGATDTHTIKTMGVAKIWAPITSGTTYWLNNITSDGVLRLTGGTAGIEIEAAGGFTENISYSNLIAITAGDGSVSGDYITSVTPVDVTTGGTLVTLNGFFADTITAVSVYDSAGTETACTFGSASGTQVTATCGPPSAGEYGIAVQVGAGAANVKAFSGGVLTATSGGGNVAPTATLTNPGNGITISTTGAYTVDGTAADSDGTVSLTEVSISDGSNCWNGSTYGAACPSWNLATGTTAWSYSWTLPSSNGGSYSVQARATDDGAATGVSGTNTVTVDNLGPTVSSTTPIDTEPSAPLDGNVTINFDEAALCTTVNTTNITSTSPGWALDAGSCTGLSATSVVFNTAGQTTSTVYSVNVTTAVTDELGNVLTASYPFSYTSGAANVNPTATLTNPGDAITISTTGAYTVDGTAADSDGSVASVDVSISDGSNCWNGATYGAACPNWVAAAGTTAWSYSWTLPSSNGGSYSVQARATDDVTGTGTSATNTVTVDNVGPSISSSTPADAGSGTIDGDVTLVFDENVDCVTVTTANITIAPAVTWGLSSCTGATAIFTPSGQADVTAYTVTVGVGVTDTLGNASLGDSITYNTVSGPSLVVGDTGAVATTYAGPSDTNVLGGGFNIALASNGGSVSVTSITADIGANWANVSNLYIYSDLDANGLVDGLDAQVGTAAPSAAAVAVGVTETVLDNSTNSYTVLYTISGSPIDTQTLTANVTAIASSGGPAPTYSDVSDGTTTIDNAVPVTTDNSPAAWSATDITVTLSPVDTGSGVTNTTGILGCLGSACTPAVLGGTTITTACAVDSFCDQPVLYYSVDDVGNTETTKTAINNAKVDRIGPTAGTFTVTPGDTLCSLSVGAATDLGVGTFDATTAYEIRESTTAMTLCTQGTSFYTSANPPTAVSDKTVLTNGTPHYFKLCYKDSLGNISEKTPGGNTVCTPAAGPTTVLSDGTGTAATWAGPSETFAEAGVFNIASNVEANTINSITVDLGANWVNVSQINIHRDLTTLGTYESEAVITGGSAAVSGQLTVLTPSEAIGINANVDYLITLNLIASPTNAQTLTANVSDFGATSGTSPRSGSDPTDGSITIDSFAPTTTDNAPGAGVWQATDTNVTLTPADSGSGVLSTKYCVDTANTCDPTSATTYSAPFTVACGAGLACTQYARYLSTDNVGIVQSVQIGQVDIDKAPPTEGTYSLTGGNGTCTVDYSTAADTGSGTSTYKIIRQSVTSPTIDCSALEGTEVEVYNGAYGTGSVVDTVTNEETHYYRVCYYDVVGNETLHATEKSCFATATNQAPVFTGSLTGKGSGSDNAVKLTWDEATDDNTALASLVYDVCRTTTAGGCDTVFTANYTTTGGAICTGSVCNYTITDATNLPNGEIVYFKVRAVDGAATEAVHATEIKAIPSLRMLGNVGFNMISVPGELGAGVSKDTVFGDDFSVRINIGWTGTRYTFATTLYEGVGYSFLRRPGTETNDGLVDPDSIGGDCGEYSCYTPQGGVVNVAVNVGWNIIGNPCLTNITGTDVSINMSGTAAGCTGAICTYLEAVNGLYINNAIYRSNGTNYNDAPQLSTGDNLEPWKGYWFYVKNTAPFAQSLDITCGVQ